MKPIEIKTVFLAKETPQEICAAILDTERWTEFRGYSFLPGIKNASYDLKKPEVTGSRIKVICDDNSTYIEEIIKWDISNRIALKFKEFDAPLKYLATHFIEMCEFRIVSGKTEITRTVTMYPKNMLGWLLLIPVSRVMKKALEKHMEGIYTSGK